MIFLGADHAGFELKEEIRKWLQERGDSVMDMGTDSKENVDFTEYAKSVAKATIEQNGKGILFCSSGQGMAIAANKVDGIRAAVAWIPEIAEESKAHSDTNVLCLPANFLKADQVKEIIDKWLSTPFASEPRYIRRIKRMKEFETN
ncbi:MAG: RpiB/LacA/LacB family sugar-phosphate isomerase [bacterium]|nr:RpiB/LacA/LacB family sugar-phosphate isomerase [bacterium]